MDISFQIHYRTQWGEDVRVVLSDGSVYPLHTHDGELWQGKMMLDVNHIPAEVSYRYAVYKEGVCCRKEWNGVKRKLILNPTYSHFVLQDSWRDRPDDVYLYSAAFTPEEPYYPTGTEVSHNQSILLKVRCPRLRHKQWQLAVSGNQQSLGNWKMDSPRLLHPCGPNEWSLLLDATQIRFPIEYKFLAWDPVENREGEWMVGDNRRIESLPVQPGEMWVISDEVVHFPLVPWKAAGVAVPVFSLRSETSCGVGDFGDLKKLVDWAVLTGQKMIQLLPINDTTLTHTWKDSYPYNSISIYAFHPMYIDLNQLNWLQDKKEQLSFEQERLRLNALPQIDYEEVNRVKMAFLRSLFKQEGEKVLATEECRKFLKDNADWLFPYAVYSYLRDLNDTPCFLQWKKYCSYRKEEIQALYETDENCRSTVHFYYFLQYILHQQLSEVRRYAHYKGVLLKGDIPIGISPNSVEAWTEPHYFNLSGQAGAPPDSFSTIGQNWGFPTYRWDVMKRDGYRWWKRRLQKMAEYFDAYRIDHLLGFFRIWEIPTHSIEGLLGQFVPSLPMSPEEIEAYGLPFRKEAFTKPLINDAILKKLFGNLVDVVKHTYLCQITPYEYALRPAFNTQQKVQAYLSNRNDRESQKIQKGLFALINNVLFIADRTFPNLYHPRIEAKNAPVFKSLTPKEQDNYLRLSDDYYYRRNINLWRQEAMDKLPELIDSTRMLVCGEDLGMIPSCVPGVIDELHILSLEIQRMPKKGNNFALPSEYPYLSVCSISTHDMSTLRGWWHENPEQTQIYYKQILGGEGKCPAEAPGWICEEIVRQHLQGNSILCILALQDWLAIDEEVRYPDADAERINNPADPNHYWRYRMHLPIEELLKCGTLNQRIRKLVYQTGRYQE